MNLILILSLGFLIDSSVIENPIDVQPQIQMIFEENLRVTSDMDDRAFFSGRFLDIDVDTKGWVFVTHGSENQIIIINPEGEVAHVLGRKGKGPGEFENLRGFKVFDDGTAMAFESANNQTILHRFDAQMQFVDSEAYTTPFSIIDFAPSEDGQTFAGMFVDFGNEKQTNMFGMLNRKMEKVYLVHQYEIPNLGPMEIENPEFWLKFIPSRLGYSAKGEVPFLTRDKQGNLYHALGKNYEIIKWSPEGKKLLTIRKKYKPKFQSDEDIEAIVAPLKESLESQVPMVKEMFTPRFLKKAIDASGYTNAALPIQGIKVTDSGHILVIHEHSFLTGEAKADVFNAEGSFLGHAEMKNNGFRIMTFKNGMAYSLSENEDDGWYLVRYKYRLEKL